MAVMIFFGVFFERGDAFFCFFQASETAQKKKKKKKKKNSARQHGKTKSNKKPNNIQMNKATNLFFFCVFFSMKRLETRTFQDNVQRFFSLRKKKKKKKKKKKTSTRKHEYAQRFDIHFFLISHLLYSRWSYCRTSSRFAISRRSWRREDAGTSPIKWAVGNKNNKSSIYKKIIKLILFFNRFAKSDRAARCGSIHSWPARQCQHV
jgi:hypothetical protein